MPGKHRTDRLRRLTRTRLGLIGPVATAAVVTASFAGGAYAVSRAGADNLAHDAPAGTPSLLAASAASSASAATLPPSPSPSPEAVRQPDQVSRGSARIPTSAATDGIVSTGTCGASFYDEPQGTANGETFDPEALTAAHKTLRFNTRVRVTNVDNGRSVVVRINDRGPYVDGRCLDLSRAAFREIEDLGAGHTTVRYEVLG